MPTKFKSLQTASAALITPAIASTLIGLAYYLLYRAQGSLLLTAWVGLPDFQLNWHDPSAGTLPSFLHMMALTCLSMAWLNGQHGLKLSLALLVMTVFAEFTFGVFDPADLFMSVLGFLFALVLVVNINRYCGFTTGKYRSLSQRQSRIAAASLVTCCSVFIGATAPCYDCGYDRDYATPVYLSYAELRSAVQVESPRDLRDIGRLYLYDNYIFLNRRNEGIHVLDNTDPRNPVNILFIAIPGNTELSIRQNFLYADSYVDLVTLNLSDPMNIQEENRQIEIFPWDEYQNVPDGVYFNYSDIDRNRGVVVDYD